MTIAAGELLHRLDTNLRADTTAGRLCRTGAVVALVLAAAFAAPLVSKGEESGGQSLQEVDQRLRVLERKQELEKENEGEKAKETAQVSVGKDGFFLKSASGDFVLRIRALVQFDGRFFNDDQERPGIDTFLIRRARPIFEGTLSRIFDFKLVPDFGEGKTVLQDAALDIRLAPWLGIMAGKYKAPVGLERLQSDSDALFVERALPSNLTPNRDLGVMLHGLVKEGTIEWAAGVFNGVADGGSGDADTDNSKEVDARVFVLPFKTTQMRSLQQLGLGVAGTFGTNEGTPATSGLAPYRAASQASFFSYRSDGTAAGTVVADGRRTRLVPQAYYYFGRFGSHAEHARSNQEVQIGTPELDASNRAWQISASFFLTDDQASFKTVTPHKPFDPQAHTWGAVEVAGRVGRLRLDEDLFPVFADPLASARTAREWTAGVNWYLNRNVKIMADYAQTRFQGGAAAGDRVDEKVVLTRFQVAF